MGKQRKLRTSEWLAAVGAADQSERAITAGEKIKVICACGEAGESKVGNLDNTLKKRGAGWRCRKCTNKAIAAKATLRVGDLNPFYGKSHSEESKAKISQARIDNPHSVEVRKATGIKARSAAYEKYQGNPMLDKDVRERHSVATSSKKFKDRASDLMTERMANPESRKKISVDSKEFWESEKGLSMRAEKSEKMTNEWNKKGGEFYEKRVAALRLAYELYGKEISEKIVNTTRARYGVSAPIKHPLIAEKARKNNLLKYGVESPNQADSVKDKKTATNVAKYGVANPSQVKEFQEKAVATNQIKYGAPHHMALSSQRQKVFCHREATKPEKVIFEMLQQRGFSFKYRDFIFEKEWDFVVYSNQEPVLVIEIDGEFNHAINIDPHSTLTDGRFDPQRFQKIPEGVKYIQIDSGSVKAAIPHIINLLGIDYWKWINDIFMDCLKSPFPYPDFSQKRMQNDWKNLLRMSHYKKKYMPCNSIITKFHRSIYTSRVGNRPSPVEAWSNPDLLLKCVRNRFIYKNSLSTISVARGFEKNKIAPRVSVFQPALARHLLAKYAPDAKSVRDPFSGFSGRMLGALSLGMDYVGSDIREEVVEESRQILNFLGLSADLKVMAVENILDDHEYDVLFTCPPYAEKEKWGDLALRDSDEYIELCLRRIKAKRYVFVVGHTEKFKEFVKEEVQNESHFSTSKEFVLVIEGT